jgi:hypothetical protein
MIARELAGRQGFELGARRFSKLVMARDFWFRRFSHKRLRRSVSFTAVHLSPPDSPPFMETFWRRWNRPHVATFFSAPRERYPASCPIDDSRTSRLDSTA